MALLLVLCLVVSMSFAVVASATFPGFAKPLAAQYPVGMEVDVNYNPKNPGDSVLRPHSPLHYVLWLVAACLLGLTWAIATGRLG